jgi:hypothetical protein
MPRWISTAASSAWSSCAARQRGGALHARVPGGAGRRGSAQVELTWNWDPEEYGSARNFGHLAYEVDDIYATCQRLMDGGVVINRPPRDGRMAFVRSPDRISIELAAEGRGAARRASPGRACRIPASGEAASRPLEPGRIVCGRLWR